MNCPKCNVQQDGPILNGYARFRCGSFQHASGENHEQSFMCRQLENMRIEYNSADKHANTLVRACETFRDGILNEIGPLEVNYVLEWFDSEIGGKL